MYRAVDFGRYPAHRFTTANAEFKVQTVFADAIKCVFDELFMLFEKRRVDHVRLDVFKRVHFRFQIHLQQQVR